LAHTRAMLEYPTREADLAKAHEIIDRYGLIEPTGKVREAVARAIADGISLGRKEGIAMVAKDIARLKGRGGAA
jgi:hypothetical protein